MRKKRCNGQLWALKTSHSIAQKDAMQVKELATLIGKTASHVSNILTQLQTYRLVDHHKEWRNHYYYASLDAEIAYSE